MASNAVKHTCNKYGRQCRRARVMMRFGREPGRVPLVAGGGFVHVVSAAARSPFFCTRWMQRAAMRALYCTEDATNSHCSGALPSPSRVDCLRAAILLGVVYISMIRAGAWFGEAWPKRGLCSFKWLRPGGQPPLCPTDPPPQLHSRGRGCNNPKPLLPMFAPVRANNKGPNINWH